MVQRVKQYITDLVERTSKQRQPHGVVVMDKVHKTGQAAACFAAAGQTRNIGDAEYI